MDGGTEAAARRQAGGGNHAKDLWLLAAIAPPYVAIQLLLHVGLWNQNWPTAIVRTLISMGIVFPLLHLGCRGARDDSET